ncbi:MAG: gamma-glutamylcyclotransferase [Acidimicrobiia bacterium]|nr:MAG: gamma-glutamylcyclotransferase [Acidimicrobiia bacterium]
MTRGVAGGRTVLLFVYGTLAPGGRAWPMLEPYAVAVRPASAPGRLYDTGRGYPAAVFGPGESRVHGTLCTLRDAPLDALDAWEGDEYERRTITTDDGTAALAYHWRAGLAGLRPLAGGRWPQLANG